MLDIFSRFEFCDLQVHDAHNQTSDKLIEPTPVLERLGIDDKENALHIQLSVSFGSYSDVDIHT